MDPPLPRFLYKKIKTPAINKPPRIIRRPLTFSIFCLFSSALPLFFSHLKHSYLDRETSLILKSIAGKPSHLLTKVTSSYTRFLSFSLHVCALLCYLSSPLLLRMCVRGKIHSERKNSWKRIYLLYFSANEGVLVAFFLEL